AVGRGCGNCLGEVQCTVGVVGEKRKKAGKITYKELYDSIKKTRVQNKDNNDSLISQINQKSVENTDLKAWIQEKVFANAALKNELRKLKGNSVDTKFVKASILGKPPLHPSRNHSVVRQPNALKSKRPRISKPRFSSQVDVKHNLPKPITLYYLPNFRESAHVKPHHVNTRNSSRNCQKEPYGSNDMAHNQFLEEARKKTQDRNWNLKPKEMPSARTHHTPNACTPKLRINNQMFRNWHASKSRLVQNLVSLTPYVPPSKKDYEIMFQPLFDEYFDPSPRVVSPDPTAVAAPRVVDPAGLPSSTTIDQDVPSASTSPTTQEI
nr:hypothetical protein [Tanacetum cinerariifolium]